MINGVSRLCMHLVLLDFTCVGFTKVGQEALQNLAAYSSRDWIHAWWASCFVCNSFLLEWRIPLSELWAWLGCVRTNLRPRWDFTLFYLVTCHQHDLNTGQHSLMLLTYSCSTKKIASYCTLQGRALHRPSLRKRRVLLSEILVCFPLLCVSYYKEFHLTWSSWTLHLIPSFQFQVSLCWFDTRHVERKYVAKSTFAWRRLTKCIKELIDMDGGVQNQTGAETNKNDGDSDGDSSEADSEEVILQNLHVTKSNALTFWCTCTCT